MEQQFKEKKKKARRAFKWHTRCYDCCVKVPLQRDEDPDKKIGEHRATTRCYENH